jgi:hypothetical protein
VFGHSPERPSLWALFKSFLQVPGAVASRWRARTLAVVDDAEAFRRPLGGYYRDRFEPMPAKADRPSVLFISPYPICPPVHGGGVFMLQTCTTLATLADLHLIVLLDDPREEYFHEELTARCASAEFIVRMEGTPSLPGSLTPHAIQEFANKDLEWLIHRKILRDRVDVVQFEYLPMGQYRCEFRRIAQMLFEHDIYFQSVGRQIPGMNGLLKRGTNWACSALSTACRCVPRPTATSWPDSCPRRLPSWMPGSGRASTWADTGSSRTTACRARCCSWDRSGTPPTPKRSPGWCSTCSRWWCGRAPTASSR